MLLVRISVCTITRNETMYGYGKIQGLWSTRKIDDILIRTAPTHRVDFLGLSKVAIPIRH